MKICNFQYNIMKINNIMGTRLFLNIKTGNLYISEINCNA